MCLHAQTFPAERSPKDPIGKAKMITPTGIFTKVVSVSSVSQTDQNNQFYKGKSAVPEMVRGCTQDEFRAASVTLT